MPTADHGAAENIFRAHSRGRGETENLFGRGIAVFTSPLVPKTSTPQERFESTAWLKVR